MAPVPELASLRITQADLDRLTGLEIGAVFMGGIIRPSAFRSWRRMLSLLVTEGLVMGVLFIMGVGVSLVLVRQRDGAPQLGGLSVGILVAIATVAIAWHLYQWHRSQRLLTLAHLLDEVDRHNDIIQALQVMDELEAIQAQAPGLSQRTEVMTALQITRDSLISALMTDRILRRHQPLIQRQQDLCRTIETNLATLQTLHINHQASEYQQFLQEALEIGIAVQQQIGSQRPKS